MAGWTNIGKKGQKATHITYRGGGGRGETSIYIAERGECTGGRNREREEERERGRRERERERGRVKARMVYCTLFDPGGRRAQTSVHFASGNKSGTIYSTRLDSNPSLLPIKPPFRQSNRRRVLYLVLGGPGFGVGKKRDCWPVPK